MSRGPDNGATTDSEKVFPVIMHMEDAHAAALVLTQQFMGIKGQISPDEAAGYYLVIRRRLQRGL